MFIKNKYYKWYSNIIQRSLTRVKSNEYELHHIIPRCEGGSNEPSNLVYLTFREHFLCHRLLTKCFLNSIKANRMFSAMCMVKSTKLKRSIKNSKDYYYYRKLGIQSLTGTKHSDLTKQKIKEALTGKKHTEERKNKIRNTLSKVNTGSGNPNSKTWKVFNTMTKEFFICNGDLLEQCKKRGISGYLLMEKHRKNKLPSVSGKTAHWVLKLLS